jgi:hypothetical protein
VTPDRNRREVNAVTIALILLVAAALVAMPLLRQLLRAIVGVLAILIAAGFLIVLAIIVLVALATHGVLI